MHNDGDTPILASLRPTLFGDAAVDRWPLGDDASGEPWSSFIAARASLTAGDTPRAIATWRAIAAMPDLESRHTLQAWHYLREHGVTPEEPGASMVLGAVADMPVDGGRDLLVAYRDGSVRYFNYSGAAAIVEPDASPQPLRETVTAWLVVAQQLFDLIGPWDKPELPALPADNARLLMLAPGGLRFGQGPAGAMMGDAKGANYINAAVAVLQAVTALRPPS